MSSDSSDENDKDHTISGGAKKIAVPELSMRTRKRKAAEEEESQVVETQVVEEVSGLESAIVEDEKMSESNGEEEAEDTTSGSPIAMF